MLELERRVPRLLLLLLARSRGSVITGPTLGSVLFFFLSPFPHFNYWCSTVLYSCACLMIFLSFFLLFLLLCHVLPSNGPHIGRTEPIHSIIKRIEGPFIKERGREGRGKQASALLFYYYYYYFFILFDRVIRVAVLDTRNDPLDHHLSLSLSLISFDKSKSTGHSTPSS